jgi:hypothetical protein
MNVQEERVVDCPYCGEAVDVVLDCSTSEEQEYIEDCQVCCRPITFHVAMKEFGGVTLRVNHENDI